MTRRVSSRWPRFHRLRDGQKLPKNSFGESVLQKMRKSKWLARLWVWPNLCFPGSIAGPTGPFATALYYYYRRALWVQIATRSLVHSQGHMYTHTRVKWTYNHIHIGTHTHVRTHAHTYAHMHTYTQTNARTNIRKHTSAQPHMHKGTFIYTHTHSRAHTHWHTRTKLTNIHTYPHTLKKMHNTRSLFTTLYIADNH